MTKKIHGMAYAYGEYDSKVKNYISSIGLKYGRTIKSTFSFDVCEDLLEYNPTCHHTDDQLFDLAEKFINLKADDSKIFYLWGHSYEFDGNKNWEMIEEFFKLISNREDIYYGTNYDVFTYYGLI